MALRVAFIGTGRKPEKASGMGYAMAYRHGEAYKLIEDIEFVAAADIVEENAKAFAAEFGVPNTYLDYNEMLEAEQPEMVSICTWPRLHEEMVVDCARAGVKAIHCEKPMADTIGGARRMVQACDETGCKLTFNHQRRYGKPFYMAKELLDDGVIGKLNRIEWGAGNLYDYGSHNFDMCNFFNDECDADWAICQIDYRTEDLYFGAHCENQALALWHYTNGAFGMAVTGIGSDTIGCHHRIVGSEGAIEIGGSGRSPDRPNAEGASMLRYWSLNTQGWQDVDVEGESCHGPNFIERCLADVVECYREGRECQMNAHNALNATEQIFACYESVRQRARVDIPIEAEDNPLVAMIESGDLSPVPA